MDDVHVHTGHFFFFFGYDVGFDISLPEAARLSEASESPGVAGLRPVPQHLQYHPKPLLLPSGPVELRAGEFPVRMEAAAKIFDFGALSIVLCLPVRDIPWKEYVRTALLLAGEGAIEDAARGIASRLFERIRPAVTRPDFADIVEDYSVWHVGAFSPELSGSQALARLPRDIAGLLTLEQGACSEEAVADILRYPIRYFENDLILAEWNAAFVYDRKFHDTIEVLEFLNVQMIELRFFDRILHTAIDEMGDELHQRRKLRLLLHDPYEKPLRRLSEIKMDVSLVRERINNALKVAGDAYLARVYDRVRRKVGAEKWEGTIRDQLKTLEDIYTILNNRAAAARAETLEMIIILLIALEIVMGLLRR